MDSLHVNQFDIDAKKSGLTLDPHRPVDTPKDWASLAHDLRQLATLASEIASIQSQRNALDILNGTVEWESV